MIKFAIDDVVFCEDVRSEIRGKHTLLGVTSPLLIIWDIPAIIPVAIWISCRPSQIGKFTAKFQVLDPDQKQIIQANVAGEVAGLGPTTIVIGPMPVNIHKPGEYNFQWNFGGKKWSNIGTLTLSKASAPNPTDLATA